MAKTTKQGQSVPAGEDPSDFFTVPPRTIDVLIAKGFLSASKRHDEDAVFGALGEFLEDITLEHETSGAERLPSIRPIPKTKPSSPSVPVPSAKPINAAMMSSSAQQLLNELTVQEFLLAEVEWGLIPAERAIDVWRRVIAKARAMNAYESTIIGAQFNRDMLLWELGQRGLV
jgi:hypothetical protein